MRKAILIASFLLAGCTHDVSETAPAPPDMAMGSYGTPVWPPCSITPCVVPSADAGADDAGTEDAGKGHGHHGDHDDQDQDDQGQCDGGSS